VFALNALVGLHGRARRYPELADALERKAFALPQKPEQVLTLVQAAAVQLDQLRDLTAAERLIAQALELDADNLEARLTRARIHVREGRNEDAVALLEELAQRTEGKRKVRLLTDIARLRLELGRPAGAVGAVEEALTIDPDAPGLDTLAIDVFARAEKWDELIVILEKAFARAKNENERRDRALSLARIFSGPRRDLDQLEQWVAKARAADPDHEAAMALEVDALIARERLEQAEKLLTQVVERLEIKRAADDLVTRSHQLGLLRMRLNRIPEALAAFNRAHDVNGKHVPNLLDYGRALILAKRWTDALAIHQALLLQRQAIPTEAERLAVLERIALASWEANQKDRAKAYLARLLTEDPQHAGGLVLKARFSA
jgi:tetratricopeptide (TPR) repeat protein